MGTTSNKGDSPASEAPAHGDTHTVNPKAGADRDEPYIHHYRSVITPGLMSVPPMPAWLRRLFRRKDTPARR